MDNHIVNVKKVSIDGPRLGNQYLEDNVLQEIMKNYLPDDVLSQIQNKFIDIGHKSAHIYYQNAKNAEANPPILKQFDAWGNRIDVIETSEGWKKLCQFSAQDGIVALAYEKDDTIDSQGLSLQLGAHRRFVQLMQLYIFQPSSGLFACPLAMTDGAAATLKHIMKQNIIQDIKTQQKIKQALKNLTSRDPSQFWTSGQWMTEKLGGSDVQISTQTVAKLYKNNKYQLYGYKWFSSATDGNMSLALAKIIDGEFNDMQDLKKISLSLFLVKMRKKNQQLNNIEVIRLKDKLGTHQLPTAELLLNGSKAYLISAKGLGIKLISEMLNITRIYNSAAAVGNIRRIVAICRDYANRREVNNTKMINLPLQKKVIFEMDMQLRANLIFYAKVSDLLSKTEFNGSSQDEQNLLRMLTPVLKLFTAKESIKVCSEGVEFFGGQGYIESSNIPVIQRDNQVLSIWEGTTNVLCMDLLRALKNKNNNGILGSYSKFAVSILFEASTSKGLFADHEDTKNALQFLTVAYNNLYTDLSQMVENPKDYILYLREINFGVARITISLLLLELWMKSGRNINRDVYLHYTLNQILYDNKRNLQEAFVNQIVDSKDINGKKLGVGNVDSFQQQRSKL